MAKIFRNGPEYINASNRINQKKISSKAMGDFYLSASRQANNTSASRQFAKSAAHHYNKLNDQHQQRIHLANSFFGNFSVAPSIYDTMNIIKKADSKVKKINKLHGPDTHTLSVGVIHTFSGGVAVATDAHGKKIEKGPKKKKADPNSKRSQRKAYYDAMDAYYSDPDNFTEGK